MKSTKVFLKNHNKNSQRKRKRKNKEKAKHCELLLSFTMLMRMGE